MWRSSYNELIWTTPKDYNYNFLHKFLTLSQHYHPPSSHWVLKCPIHGFFFPNLLKEFPSATIVVTHRDPLKTIPSIAKLLGIMGAFFVRDVQTDGVTPYMFKESFGLDMCDFSKRIVYTIMETRKVASDEDVRRIMDVEYEDIIKDPMGVVKKIYRKAGLEMSAETERKMAEYIEENRQEREKGKGSAFLPYALEEFGLTEEYVREEMAEYRQSRGYL